MAGETDDANIVAEVLATELCSDADLAGEIENLLFPLEITEAMASLGTLGGERIEVVG